MLTTIAALIDFILSVAVRKTDGVITLNWGTAVWLALAGAALLGTTVVGTCIPRCRRRRDAEKY
jgi:hypothetical protein